MSDATPLGSGRSPDLLEGVRTWFTPGIDGFTPFGGGPDIGMSSYLATWEGFEARHRFDNVVELMRSAEAGLVGPFGIR